MRFSLPLRRFDVSCRAFSLSASWLLWSALLVLPACRQAPALPPAVVETTAREEVELEAPETKSQNWVTAELKKLLSSKQACAESVGYQGKFERCSAAAVGNGRGLLVRLVTECGGDSCSSEAYLIEEGAKVRPLPNAEGGSLAFDPELSFYVIDVRNFENEADRVRNHYTRAPVLQRVELSTGRTSRFASCMSPTLDPTGAWFLCRNQAGDVLRVALSGGDAELVAINPAVGEIHWSPYAYIYPSPVEFESSEVFSFDAGDGSGGSLSRPWDANRPSLASQALRAVGKTRTAQAIQPHFCDGATEPRIVRACKDGTLGGPALSANGWHVELIESVSSCCAESVSDTSRTYALNLREGQAKESRSQVLYEKDVNGRLLTLAPSTEAGVINLLDRLRKGGSVPLPPLPLADSTLAAGLYLVQLANGEDLIWSASGLRMLNKGKVSWHQATPRSDSHPFCCGHSPNQDGSWDGVDGCQQLLLPKRGWYSQATGVLVLAYENSSGPDGCELGPVFEVVRLPRQRVADSAGQASVVSMVEERSSVW